MKTIKTRQRNRQLLLLISLLLFPITMNYFSPYVVIDGAVQGILTGSVLVFGVQFVSAILFGRLFCGWLCPAGALQDACQGINNKPVSGKFSNWIKWIIWIPWLSYIGFLVIKAGGYHQVNLLHLTESGISVDEPVKFFNYYFVVGLFVVLAALLGRRAGCHSLCWMAPFMIIGRKTGNALRLPGLRLQAEPEKCTNCKTCTTSCPMSLDVNGMVQARKMENAECIFCGSCVDGCTRKAIGYRFMAEKV
jgi:ferredoxin-type protein NapH